MSEQSVTKLLEAVSKHVEMGFTSVRPGGGGGEVTHGEERGECLTGPCGHADATKQTRHRSKRGHQATARVLYAVFALRAARITLSVCPTRRPLQAAEVALTRQQMLRLTTGCKAFDELLKGE